jgi:hypothetical protein
MSDDSDIEDGAYYLRIEGDRERLVADDIREVIEEHYSVKATRLGKDEPRPYRIPLEVKLTVRDCYGRESFYSGTWQVVESEPGQKGLLLQTGLTNQDLDGVRAEVEIRIGLGG